MILCRCIQVGEGVWVCVCVFLKYYYLYFNVAGAFLFWIVHERQDNINCLPLGDGISEEIECAGTRKYVGLLTWIRIQLFL